MKPFTLLSVLALLILSACAPSTESVQTAIAETQAVQPSEELTGRLNHLLEEGSTLTAMSVQGVKFEEFRQQLAEAKGAYSLALSAQSAQHNIRPEVVEALDQAFTGWDLAHSVWNARLNGGDAPRAPDVGRYSELVSYVGLDKLPMVGTEPESYVDQDQVIRILMNMAMHHFNDAQLLLLEQLK